MRTKILYNAIKSDTQTEAQRKLGELESPFHGMVQHVGHLSKESALKLATKHAARRGWKLKEIEEVYYYPRAASWK